MLLAAVLALLLRDPAVDWSEFQSQGKQAYAQENFTEAEKLFTRALEAAEQFKPGDVRLYSTLNNLAATRTQLAKFREADELFERLKADTSFSETDSQHTEAVIQSGINHAALTFRRGDPYHARQEFESALRAAEQALGPEDTMVAQACNHLALFYRDTAQFKLAQQYGERALAIREKNFGAGSIEVAGSLSILSQVVDPLGDHSRAQTLCRRALAIREQILGTEHPSVAESVSNLGTLLKAEGNYPEAERQYRRAEAIWAKSMGAESFGVALALNNLAALHQVQAKYRKAEEEFGESVRMMERATGASHPSFALILTNFASLYRDWHKYDKAEALLRRALEINESKLGPLHPFIAVDLISLSDIEAARHDMTAAERLLIRALSIYEGTAGKDSFMTARAAFRLATLYQFCGKPKEAAPFFKQAVAVWDVKGQADLQIAAGLENYSVLLKRNQQFAEAEQVRTMAVGIRVQAAKNGVANAFPQT
jgi:tetratricopeptide (TPR) repeat protein